MFGLVVTTEDHLASSGARRHSNNTAEMTAMIEALSFLGPHGPVTRDEHSCIYYDSMHAAGMCLDTIQARTHVQVARMSCWVQCGSDEFASLRTWISENCEEFREMQIVRHAKFVGTMIGPHGHLHRWTAARRIRAT